MMAWLQQAHGSHLSCLVMGEAIKTGVVGGVIAGRYKPEPSGRPSSLQANEGRAGRDGILPRTRATTF
jgi:hypothetical protein